MSGDWDTRYIAYLIWGVGVVFVYGLVFVRRRRFNARRHDARSRRELIEAGAEFLVAVAAAASITVILLFGEQSRDVRGFFSAVALGMFFAAGVVKVTEQPQP